MTPLLAILAATPPSSAYVQVRNQGADAGYARVINCTGGGISCSVDSTTNLATFSVSGSSPLPDGGSSASVGPYCSSGYVTASDGGAWYCTNGIATANALAANPTDCAASRYATTIDAQGNLTCAQVAYSQLSGSPTAGGNPPQMQYNNGGVLGGVTNVTGDGTHSIYSAESSLPAAPGSGLVPFASADNSAIPPDLAAIDSSLSFALPVGHKKGRTLAMREGNGPSSHSFCWYPQGWGSTTAVLADGLSTSLSVAGSSAANWDAGSLLGRSRHITCASGTGSNAVAGVNSPSTFYWRGAAAGQGGFQVTSRQWHNCGGSPSCRIFIGFAGQVSACSALTANQEYKNGVNNSAYIGADGPDSNLQACSKDLDSGVATCTDLGSSFPKGAGGYEVTLYAAPNDTGIHYEVVRLDSAAVASGVMTNTLPLQTTQLCWYADTNNTDAGRNTLLDFEGVCSWEGW